MHPEIQHLRRVQPPKTQVLAFWNTVRIIHCLENMDRFLDSSRTIRTDVVNVRCPYDKPFSSWVRASGLSLEGRCTLVEKGVTCK